MGDTSSNLRDRQIGNTEFLVGKAKAGSEAAWKEIYARYKTMLVAQVQARIPGFARRRFDADDVLQVAIMRAWQSLPDFEYRGDGSFRRWLATLVIRTFDSALRDGRPDVGAEERGLSKVEDESSGLSLELRQERVAMLEALGKMDDEDRDLLIQRHFEELSFEQIGEILGCSREKARGLYTLAFQRLQRLLGI